MGATLGGSGLNGATIHVDQTVTEGEIVTQLVNSTDGQGLHFDGAAGNIDIAPPPDLGTKFSFEFIIQADSWGSTNQQFIDFGSGGRFVLYADLGGTGYISVYDSSSVLSFGVAILDDLKVHHLVLTIDGTAAVLYDNANQVGTATISASHDLDLCSNARIATNHLASADFFDGTLYRARLWNKTLTQAEVTASYENATVPFADQYGSQTELIANGDFASAASWSVTTPWSIGSGKATADGTSSNRIYQNTVDKLVVGKKFNYSFDWNRTGGTSIILQYHNGTTHVDVATITDTGSGTATGTFTVTGGTNQYIYFFASGNWSGDIDNVSVVRAGVVSDYDLAFANPARSFMVQDRAGAADGEASNDGTNPTGISQVTPIEQLNSKSARIGTTAATPADGDLLVSGNTTIGSSLLIRGDNTSSDPGMPYIRSNGSYLVINSDPDNAMYLQNDGSGDLSLCQGGGSVGVGVSAEAWTIFTALQIGSAGVVCGRASNQTDLATNWYYDGTEKRINAGYAQRYTQSTTGTHAFYTATTSTANSEINWGTAALTIDSAGNVGIGKSPDSFASTYTGVSVGGNGNLSVTTSEAAAGNTFLSHNTYYSSDANKWRYISAGAACQLWLSDGTFAVRQATTSTSADGQTNGDGSFTTPLTIDASGNVGLSTAAIALTGNLLTIGGINSNNDNDQNCLRFIDAGGNLMGKILSRRGADGNKGSLKFLCGNSPVLSLTVDETGLATANAIVETGGVLKENLLTNSGFDVWSNSTLETVATLAEDDCASDDTGDWTKSASVTLGFDTDHYEIASPDQDAMIYLPNISLTAGKLYRISFNVKNGTASGCTVKTFFYDGASQYGADTTTTVSFETVATVFEAAATTSSGQAGVRVDTDLNNNNIEINNFSLKEVTPGCVSSGAENVDGWQRRGGTATKCWRQHSDGDTEAVTKLGSFYSLKTVSTTSAWNHAWPDATLITDAKFLAGFAGRKVTAGCWVYSTLATPEIRLNVYTGSDNFSTQTVEQNTWTWLETTATCPDALANFQVQLNKSSTTSETYYVSQVCLVLGSAIGSGNYSRPSGEIVWCEKEISLTDFESDAISSPTDINVEAQSSGKIPKGAAAVAVKFRTACANTGKQAALGSTSSGPFQIETYSTTASQNICDSGWARCDADGDLSLYTQPAQTFTTSIAPVGVQLR